MKRILFLIIPLFTFFFVACNEKESSIGLGLQDPATLYDGKFDTLSVAGCTMKDDSLVTTNYSQGLLGRLSDSWRTQEAIIYSQVANTSENSINWGTSTIDSVVLSLSVQDLYPASLVSAGPLNLHFEVKQLSEDLYKDTTYYAFSSAAVGSTTFFDGMVSVVPADTVIRLKFNSSFANILDGNNFSNQELISAIKGIRIRMLSDGDQAMFTVNFNAAVSGVIVYRTYEGASETTHMQNLLSIGAGGVHFNQYITNYSGSVSLLNTLDSISGTTSMHLIPMGGSCLKLNLTAAVKQFNNQHPHAIIHYAELQLPVVNPESTAPPKDLVVLKYVNDSVNTYIPDMSDGYTSGSLDYRYNEKTQSYKLRITQHFQKLLYKGFDPGTLVLINSRRSSANRVEVAGCAPSSNGQTRIVVVYSEL